MVVENLDLAFGQEDAAHCRSVSNVERFFENLAYEVDESVVQQFVRFGAANVVRVLVGSNSKASCYSNWGRRRRGSAPFLAHLKISRACVKARPTRME